MPELGQKGGRVRIAHGLRQSVQAGGLLRKQVRLLVILVLQHVFEPPQQAVGVGQQGGVDVGQQTDFPLRGQRFQQVGGLQRRVPPAPDELEQLDDELDFPDAAFAQLDVVVQGPRTARGIGLAVPVFADALAQRPQRGEGVKVKVFAEDEGLAQRFELIDLVGEVAARKGLNLNAAGFQPGIALPFPALRHQVMLQRMQAPGQRTAIAIRTQPQVRAEDITIGVYLRQDPHHPARQAAVELMVGERAAPLGFTVFAVQHDEVDVGRHVEFAAAELAHAEDQHLLRQAGVRVKRRAVHLGHLGGHAQVGLLHGQVRQGAHGQCDFPQRGQSGNVAHHQAGEGALAQRP